MPLSITFIARACPFLRLLPRAGAEELQLLLPWVPALSFSCTLFFHTAAGLRPAAVWDGIDRITLQAAWQERHTSKNISPPGRRRLVVECWHIAVWLGEVFFTRIPWRWSDGPACSRWQLRYMYTIITISGAISGIICRREDALETTFLPFFDIEGQDYDIETKSTISYTISLPDMRTLQVHFSCHPISNPIS
jgi:hypothetical protein